MNGFLLKLTPLGNFTFTLIADEVSCEKSLVLPKYCSTCFEKVVNCWVAPIIPKIRIKLKISCLIFFYLPPFSKRLINNPTI